MKIIFDIDGTMTDFRAYIDHFALPWFYRKYRLLPQKENELELEDILDLRNVIQAQKGCTVSEAEKEEKEMLNRFWFSHRFIHFSLLDRLLPGCASAIRALKRLGGTVEVYTSRAHAADRNLVGSFVRFCTVGQLWLNGVIPSKIHFFQNDEEKLAGMLQARPNLVFDDKVTILKELKRNHIPVVCMAGPHNTELQNVDGIERIKGYQDIKIDKLLEKVLSRDMPYLLRAANSERLWKKLQPLIPIFRWYFHPIELNASRRLLTEDEPVLYAPNHRSTLDPLVISSVTEENIHWAALLRFFQAKDSIFNNSKNPFLCKITAWLFHKLDYFPIERRADNPDANNMHAIRDMVGFLRIRQKVGIFGEGTTRRPENADFGIFDESIIVLAERTGAWIQPATIYWATASKRKQVVLNWGEAFKVDDRERAMQSFLQIQQQCLQENIEYTNQYLS